MLIDLIMGRRSVRSYSEKSIEKEKILKCLEAARLAPSACNSQPWKFIVVDDSTLKDKLCDVAFSGPFSMNKFAKEAPVIIVVISERRKIFTAIAEFLRDTKYFLVDIGIACEHLILQAQELGLGTCWLGWFDERAVKKILNIPWNKKVDILISLGYPKDSETRQKKREELPNIASFNKY